MSLSKITVKELSKKLEKDNGVFVLDVRAEEKFKDFHIDESTNIPKTNIFELDEKQMEVIDLLPKDKEIVVTCTTGNSARKCAEILAEKDYKVTVLEGGLTAWKEYVKEKGE
ncbi:rhodanese-like domain-containing protein [Ferdinandcohnia quinoae]|uniref:Rhodanese-like domain-containing protein n=1 Tax=Fredinandcohnia quinoae TaxID=2918902 RepID=A0AAW5DTN1_9BACI|nr:rhodanese-like domain-containing protein [Fredinandcohnia sp. SECRCQ15]MCH1624001.1 rhodanese-like domain-containing protein [Fredinandcohnia sp. SECRCQ15]